MSCSPFDLRDYFLKELPEPQRRLTEEHVRGCPACREELDRLQITEAALLALREEEIPQRIAFVSDQVFEPSPWKRWLAAFWGSAPRLGFASAALLSVAILVSALTRPAGVPQRPPAAQAPAVTASLSTEEVQTRIQASVDKAVRESDARHERATKELVTSLEGRFARERAQALLMVQTELEWERKRSNTNRILASSYGPPKAGSGEAQ